MKLTCSRNTHLEPAEFDKLPCDLKMKMLHNCLNMAFPRRTKKGLFTAIKKFMSGTSSGLYSISTDSKTDCGIYSLDIRCEFEEDITALILHFQGMDDADL